MIQAMKNLNLLQKMVCYKTFIQQKINRTKTILFKIRQKLLSQVFAVILMHL